MVLKLEKILAALDCQLECLKRQTVFLAFRLRTAWRFRLDRGGGSARFQNILVSGGRVFSQQCIAASLQSLFVLAVSSAWYRLSTNTSQLTL